MASHPRARKTTGEARRASGSLAGSGAETRRGSSFLAVPVSLALLLILSLSLSTRLPARAEEIPADEGTDTEIDLVIGSPGEATGETAVTPNSVPAPAPRPAVSRPRPLPPPPVEPPEPPSFMPQPETPEAEAAPPGTIPYEPVDWSEFEEYPEGDTAETAASGDGGTWEVGAGPYPRPFAMMVENEPPARPQSGLNEAHYVFEIIAEEITRFMAIYLDHDAGFEVGPIRSARHYFADISTMFDAVYVHVGGSPRGLQFLKEHRVDTVNAIRGDRGFYRTRDRRIPHNLYTRPSSVRAECERKRHRIRTAKEPPFRFLDKPAYAEHPVMSVTIPYYKNYVVGWDYLPDRGVYRRRMNGQPFRAKETEAFHDAENVILQRVKSRMVDAAMRHDMDLSAGGTCEVLVGGALLVGTWERPDGGDFVYTDETGREIWLNPGKVWVQFVEPDCLVEYR